MDSGWSVVVGALVGGAASIASTALAEFLRDRRTNKLDSIRKDVLKKLLSGEKYEWRSLSALADAIGADEETTARLLLEIGARHSLAKGSDSWGLKPFPDDIPSN
jgi:hypothetical protein